MTDDKPRQRVTYYKATQPNGTDFFSGTIDYAAALKSGEPLKRLTSADGRYACCTPTVYHAADTPSETLIGGWWPCRLFRVAGRPVAREGHKLGFRSLRVVEEVEAWQALGPNGREIVALIDQALALTRADIGKLRDTRDITQNVARNIAWKAARDASREAAWSGARDAAWGTLRSLPGNVVGDAAQALVVKDLISSECFDTLYGPWRSVTEA